MSPDYAVIRQALNDRKVIRGMYHGKERIMCPHVLGTTDGHEQCLFFQFAGGSKSGLPPGGQWRCIPLSGLTEVSVIEGEWHSGTSQHIRPQNCVQIVDVQVPI